MSSASLLLSTAYFPPVHYFSLIDTNDGVLIENRENYVKQTYRNRCRIYSANGPIDLSVPVFDGSFRKRPISEIRIDHTRRWQQVHTGAIESAYRSTPYFEYYFDGVRDIIQKKFELLTDLNRETLKWAFGITGTCANVTRTESFVKPDAGPLDWRYKLSPKRSAELRLFSFRTYEQAFSERYGFIPGLSILDLIFNMGPDSGMVIRETQMLK